MEFFDRNGAAVVYSPDGEHLYAWDGRPLGYLYQDRIYNFGGTLIGWLQNGWIYDRANKPALFTAEATGGPVRPVRRVKPVKGVRGVRPVRGVRQVTPVRGVRSLNWSDRLGGDIFDGR